MLFVFGLASHCELLQRLLRSGVRLLSVVSLTESNLNSPFNNVMDYKNVDFHSHKLMLRSPKRKSVHIFILPKIIL